MTGEPQRDDEPDFLDDFIIEDDAAAKDDDLDTLFEDPKPGPVPLQASGKPGEPKPAPDAEDVLFTDHTVGLSPSETFAKAPDFAEQAPSTWQGETLDLGADSASTLGVPVDDDAGTPADRGEAAPAEAEAEDAFEAELESLLQAEDEFALDSEKELELIDPAEPSVAGAAPAEPLAADTFVLDDGEGLWQEGTGEPSSAAAAGDEAGELELLEPNEALRMIEAIESGEPLESAVVDAAPTEPGWEPLPGASMDELAEVTEVDEVASAEDAAEPVDGAAAAQTELPRPALVGGLQPAAEATELEELYAEAGAGDAGPQLVGGSRQGRRGLRLVGSLAASLAVVAALAMVLLQPQWFGLRFDPEQVQSVQVQRPKVDVVVPTPPAPVVPAPVVPAPVVPTPVVPEPTAPTPVAGPAVSSSNQGQGQVGTATGPAAGTPPVAPVEATPEPVVPPVQQDPTPTVVPVPVPVPSEVEPAWPVAQGAPPRQDAGAPNPGLVRIGEDLLVGAHEKGEVRVVDGMIPGSRAFAQLHNGNYFIGSVKHADKDRITLRVGTGEVTLAMASLAKLTALGSADYDELQKVTSGFVRLRNNNRLVGGILSGIADDHVVLEFRSNRVMLPKSAVGEVVEGEDDAAVRLGTTREEEDWVQKLAERQLGTGAPPVEAKPATPPAGPRGNR
jgi:hypothetical protein